MVAAALRTNIIIMGDTQSTTTSMAMPRASLLAALERVLSTYFLQLLTKFYVRRVYGLLF